MADRIAGQGIQFFGNVTGAIQFDVNVDGAVTRGAPAGQMLASVSGLQQSDHSVSLTVTQVGSGSQLLFESAIVTVGTGFTGCVVVHPMFIKFLALTLYHKLKCQRNTYYRSRFRSFSELWGRVVAEPI
jgi:hypothetical protein